MLNWREFMGLPPDWAASFGDPDVRTEFSDFAGGPPGSSGRRYLGLASEINIYADAHPDDFPHFLSLYQEVYATVKEDSPQTQVFVPFQWEDLNNVFPEISEGRAAYDVDWNQAEAIEPEFDTRVISSYPFFAFPGGAEIPDNYYAALLERTDKPLAVGESGYTSRPPRTGSSTSTPSRIRSGTAWRSGRTC